jgi:predicted dehydrogenase
MSPPTRIAMIGLGKASDTQVFGLWAARAHLPFIVTSPDFEITAVCNSSVQSAQNAIEFHKLSSSVKAYGSVTDVAHDPNVDMAVISVRVSAHHSIAEPLIKAGKDIFMEWPLATTLTEAEE